MQVSWMIEVYEGIAYLREEVVVDLHAAVGEQLGKVNGGTDEEVIAHDVGHHSLVHVLVVYVLPICVLEHLNSIAVSAFRICDMNYRLLAIV